MIKLSEKIYDSEDKTITVDSLANGFISKPFFLKETQYLKVDYYMVMHMKYKQENKMDDSTFISSISEALQNALPHKIISYNSNAHYFIIRGMDVLLAIKDSPSSEWFF